MSLLDIFRIKQIKSENESLKFHINMLNNQLNELGYNDYAQVRQLIVTLQNEANALEKDIIDKRNHANEIKESIDNEIDLIKFQFNETSRNYSDKTDELRKQYITKEKQLKTTINKIAKNKEIISAIDYAIINYFNKDINFNDCLIKEVDKVYLEELLPNIILKLNSMNVTDLRKANNANNKQIQDLLNQYKDRYTTKANKTIYSLMVIALRSELQNILIEMKYEKLDNAIGTLKNVTAKYLAIASEGNQNIAGTLTKFIGEVEYLFINAIKIEYNYYVKKEQAKQEQLAIRAQMRQEAEERKALEAEKKKIEKEESKYCVEIEKVNEQLQSTSDNIEIEKLKARLLELELQLSEVVLKKEEVINLQNGKAGTVYIISNLGSFGEEVFKIGMTRRLEPIDRVNELGDASVPFKFDVHSFIFSDDAANLETLLHNKLNEKRLNKVNRRKEFFKISISELETLVLQIQPTAEFNKTMLAEEFRQSLSSDEVYSDNFIMTDLIDDE